MQKGENECSITFAEFVIVCLKLVQEKFSGFEKKKDG